MKKNITVVIQTPIGEVHAECEVTPPERRPFAGGYPYIDPPDPGECEIGNVWISVDAEGEGRLRLCRQPIDEPADFLFWTPRLTKSDWSELLGKWLIQRSTDRQDMRNWTSLDQMIAAKVMEEA